MENYVVIARYDDETNLKMSALYKHLCTEGCIETISEWPPHITLAAYENISISALLQWTERFVQKHSAFEVMFASVGVLPPGGEHTNTVVLYAAPSQSLDLIDFYYAFHEELDEYCGNLGWWYTKKCGHPVIHSTIGIFEVLSMQKAMELILTHQIFGIARINALEVYTYPMKLIKRFELSKIK